MIRSAPNVLSSASGQINERLDSSSLRTLFYECMAIINSRPLTTVKIASNQILMSPYQFQAHLIVMMYTREKAGSKCRHSLMYFGSVGKKNI